MSTPSLQPGTGSLSKALRYFDPAFQKNKLIRTSPDGLFRMIQVLESAISMGMSQQLIEIGHTQEGAERIYRRWGRAITAEETDARKQADVGRQAFIHHTEAQWSVTFARDKLFLYDIGAIAAKNGDLPKARLLPSPEQVINLYRWKQFREHPEPFGHVVFSVFTKGGGYAKNFFRRLGDVGAKPAEDFLKHIKQLRSGAGKDSRHRQLQEFLLDGWARSILLPNGGGVVPAFYTFKAKALFSFVYEVASKADEHGKGSPIQAVLEMDESSFGTVRRRLGLQQPDDSYWEKVDVERSRRAFLEAGDVITIWGS